MAGYTTPWNANNFIGSFVDAAACLAEIQSRKWDSLGTGLGTPQNGMWYYDTTANDFYFYANGAWVPRGGSAVEDIILKLAVDRQVVHGTTVAAAPFIFDASRYTGRNWFVRGVLWVGGPTSPLTVTAKLVNVTDTEDVTDATLSTTQTAATAVTSPGLEVGEDPGMLQPSAKIYEVQLSLAGGASADDLGLLGSFELYGV